MWLMLQHSKADDYVIATNQTHTVKEFVELAFKQVGISIKWKGNGTNIKGIDKQTNKILVEIDPKYYRPAEVELLVGNPKKANKQLKWKVKTSFKQLVSLMVKFDMNNEAKTNGWKNY